MMSIWKNGIISAIIQSKPDYASLLKNTHFYGNQENL